MKQNLRYFMNQSQFGRQQRVWEEFFEKLGSEGDFRCKYGRGDYLATTSPQPPHYRTAPPPSPHHYTTTTPHLPYSHCTSATTTHHCTPPLDHQQITTPPHHHNAPKSYAFPPRVEVVRCGWWSSEKIRRMNFWNGKSLGQVNCVETVTVPNKEIPLPSVAHKFKYATRKTWMV
jgi:hypothetical protein